MRLSSVARRILRRRPVPIVWQILLLRLIAVVGRILLVCLISIIRLILLRRLIAIVGRILRLLLGLRRRVDSWVRLVLGQHRTSHHAENKGDQREKSGESHGAPRGKRNRRYKACYVEPVI